jgi:hypothetical protein
MTGSEIVHKKSMLFILGKWVIADGCQSKTMTGTTYEILLKWACMFKLRL